MNYLGKKRCPFLFVIDFEQRQPLVIPLEDIDPEVLQYDFPEQKNGAILPGPAIEHIVFKAVPIPFTRYNQSYELVQKHLRHGDSFLLNLTFPTRLTTNLTIRQMFEITNAPYRLWWRGHFSCFSPETFVRIRQGRIFSYPMKGTLDTRERGGAAVLLNNPKEKAEHATIVDLIRNDLSQVARKVRVDRYRYLEKIPTSRGGIWQTSSEVSGTLPANYHEMLGDLLCRLLPAGSISGAPKPKTVEIIREAEGYERGYYTGVAGIFDGRDLDSAVLIRYVEETPDGLFFKSGGGITTFSEVEKEYREMIRKVDLPMSEERVAGNRGAVITDPIG
jgi:para-aminobenzoate synthetase component 1